jgi:hypothetical protein
LWTEDYINFIEEGAPGIGFPVWDGGLWYPTTHVTLEYDPSAFVSLRPKDVTDFFYYFANINLVLAYITLGIKGTIKLHTAVEGYIEIEA